VSEESRITSEVKIMPFQRGHTINNGRVFTDEHKRKISEAMKGKIKPASYSINFSKARKGKCMGSDNPNWKGGITFIYDAIRTSLENKQWTFKVFERDDFTCQDCGSEKNLQAHHKKSFAYILKEFLDEYNQFSPIEDKETLIRLAVNYKPFWEVANGKTLCEDCHKHYTRSKHNGMCKT
jgi:hypothetical protein